MNQEKISAFIKKVRAKDKLSQEKFGEKYGVTYQAVSKWENGKNLPDIAILKEICNDYNVDINELINENKNYKRKNKKILIILILFIFLFIGLGIYIFVKNNNDDSFNFKTIKTSCENFNLYGSIAYDNNKTSIYISNITYCGLKTNNVYKELQCTLYEVDNNIKTKIESVDYNETIDLDTFLKNVKFNVEHYSKSCKMYKENGLLLEIKGTLNNDEKMLYEIPLVLEDNCK